MSKRGYSLERFQAPFSGLQLPWDVVPGAPPTLAGVAGAVLATWFAPLFDPTTDGITAPLYIRTGGFNYASAGGIQTVNGAGAFYLNGVIIQDNTLVSTTLAAIGQPNHAIGASVGVNLNLTPPASSLVAPPVYSVMQPGDVLTFRVLVQGAGAGLQTIYPWVCFTEAPGIQT